MQLDGGFTSLPADDVVCNQANPQTPGPVPMDAWLFNRRSHR